MAKIIVEEVQGGSGGDALTLPTADGTAGQFIKTDGSGALTFGGVDVSSYPPADNSLAIGALFSHSNRQNIYSTGGWTTSGPWTTYNHELDETNDLPQAWNMLMGDGMPKNSQNADNSYKTFSGNWTGSRYKLFAHNRRLGYTYRYFYWHENGTSYPGCTWACIPIRNTGSSSVNCEFKTTCTTQQGYAGTGKAYYTPSGGTGNYAGTTGGSWTVLHSNTSDSAHYDNTCTVPVPAGRTVLFMVTSSWDYRTSNQFFDTLLLRELQTSFTHSDIQCDLRMLEALYMGRQPAADYNVATPYELYTTCASLFGDR